MYEKCISTNLIITIQNEKKYTMKNKKKYRI